MSSERKSSRAVARLSWSGIAYAFLTRDRSAIGGMKSSPMPSTTHDPASPIFPVSIYGVSTEPAGSASTISVRGLMRAKKRLSPVSVPPDPTPQTTASTS